MTAGRNRTTDTFEIENHQGCVLPPCSYSYIGTLPENVDYYMDTAREKKDIEVHMGD
jgi:hypothetical protein